MFSYDVKFLTCDESLHLKNGDFKTYKYETKKKVDESVYDVGKRSFCERRGGNWRAFRPRQIRQLESKLRDRSVVFCDWTHDNLITIVFSSGAIAYLTVKPESLDVTQILFDRYCVGKLSGHTVTNVVLCNTHILLTHTDRMATLISFGKTNCNQPCRITDRDPHLQCIELGGCRRGERHVSWRVGGGGVRVLVWAAAAAEPAPWSPAAEDLANLHLYQIQGHQVTLIGYHQLKNDSLSAELSHQKDNIVHIVEQLAGHKTGITLNWSRYDIPTDERTTKLSSLQESTTQATLPAPARIVRRSTCDSKLLIACIDGSLHVINDVAGLTHSVRAGFIATDVRWAGEVILAAEEAGRLQCFDRALSLLHHHTKCLDLTTYLRDTRRIQVLASKALKCGPVILTAFSGGPLALLKIMHPRLLTGWIRAGRTSNAVALLRAVDWEVEGTEGLWAVNKLVCYALRAPLDANSEAVAEAALGAYLSGAAPAPRFAPAVHDIARKFFHHLLRRGRIEKAMSLAVDLADWDLFADARWAAARGGATALAEEAASLAAHYAADTPESECSDSCSQCSSHTYSESEAETSASSEHIRTKPPPLPRVPIPQNPTIPIPQNPTIPIPITQTEPMSTQSIRPNLHQYLERDNTIWNTNVKDDTHITNNYIKPILSYQNSKWHSVDNVLSYTPQHISINGINKPRSILDVARHEERLSTHFRHIFQSDVREEIPNTLYRYQNSNYPSSSVNERLRHDAEERPANRNEKNKVKFSDTVTIAVVPEPQPAPCPARELADSLPLCAPHRFLSAFAAAPENPPQEPLKIKVVHFGMV